MKYSLFLVILCVINIVIGLHYDGNYPDLLFGLIVLLFWVSIIAIAFEAIARRRHSA